MFLCCCCHIAVNVCGCLQVIRNYSLSLGWIVQDAFFIVYLNTADITGYLGWLRLYVQWICHAWGHDKRDTSYFKRKVKRILNMKKSQGFRCSGMWCYVIWCVFFDVWKDPETVFKSKQSKKTVDCLPWKLNITWSFQTLGTIHPVTQHRIPENLNHQQHCHENPEILHQEEEAITAVDAIVETGDRHSRKTDKCTVL